MTAVFCCVGALAITGSLHHIDKDLLGWWLCERQVKSGGLNGRPEKLPDVGISKTDLRRVLSLISVKSCNFYTTGQSKPTWPSDLGYGLIFLLGLWFG